ncbi:hypothetical protein [Paramylibacter kogurei]|uniref:hypothetical protein n=1 Tax=Paramylibacter kogurei TaxID=1889778 RepID=UPI0013FDEC7F|nr:hypothetical protein [Amylibacter kogurei]
MNHQNRETRWETIQGAGFSPLSGKTRIWRRRHIITALCSTQYATLVIRLHPV